MIVPCSEHLSRYQQVSCHWSTLVGSISYIDIIYNRKTVQKDSEGQLHFSDADNGVRSFDSSSISSSLQ